MFYLQEGNIRSELDPYNLVRGSWNVEAHCSMWVGLDGFNRSDLVQKGTESYGIIYRNGLVEIQVSSRYAWYEILPEAE